MFNDLCDRRDTVSKHWFHKLPSQKYKISKFYEIRPRTIQERSLLLKDLHKLYYDVENLYNEFESDYMKNRMLKIRIKHELESKFI
jgi:hypothetical protein